MHGQTDLFKIVGTFDPRGGFSHFLDSGQKQTDQDRNDRDHHQQLYKSKTTVYPFSHGYASHI
jgi:hypothetical protein